MLLQNYSCDARPFGLNNAYGIGGAINRDGIACRCTARHGSSLFPYSYKNITDCTQAILQHYLQLLKYYCVFGEMLKKFGEMGKPPNRNAYILIHTNLFGVTPNDLGSHSIRLRYCGTTDRIGITSGLVQGTIDTEAIC